MKREMMVYLPKLKEFLYVAEGPIYNLVDDLEDGYVDYVNIEVYVYADKKLIEIDGAQKLLRQYFYLEYKDDINGDQLIRDAMDIIWGITDLEYIEIEGHK